MDAIIPRWAEPVNPRVELFLAALIPRPQQVLRLGFAGAPRGQFGSQRFNVATAGGQKDRSVVARSDSVTAATTTTQLSGLRRNG